MTTRTLHRICIAAAIAAVLAAIGAPQPAGAESVPIVCYDASADGDGDGYAHKDASPTQDPAYVDPDDGKVYVDEDKKLYCPGDLVAKKGDCDDARADIHPRAPELAFNGRNDDCDKIEGTNTDLTDEPELVYFSNGNQNTETGFAIRVRIASALLRDQGSALAYDVEYVDLAGSALPAMHTPQRFVGALPADFSFDAPVSGLQPARVYRARLRFYRGTVRTTLLGKMTRKTTTFTDLGVASEWYYTTTDGSGVLEDARSALVLEGFKQLSESDRGRVGYLGTVKRDGTRYGASAKERWCSEFYTWLASSQFWGIGAWSTVGGVQYWFASYAAYHDGSSAIPAVADRGDYIPVATDGKGAPNHSTMFLAFDVTTNKVWTLEGNYSNDVQVAQRPLDAAKLKGLGHLSTIQLIVVNLGQMF